MCKRIVISKVLVSVEEPLLKMTDIAYSLLLSNNVSKNKEYPWEDTPYTTHTPSPLVDRMTHASENITFPHTLYAAGNKLEIDTGQ